MRNAGEHIAFPDGYKRTVLKSFIEYFETLGKEEFERIIKTHNSGLKSEEVGLKGVIRDVAEAVLHRNPSSYSPEAFRDLEAFQAIVSAIHKMTALVDSDGVAPLAVWSKARGRSPYALPVSSTRLVNVRAGVVCLPPDYRHAGLLAWSSMGHEVGGHHFIGAHMELVPQFKAVIQQAIVDNTKIKGEFPSRQHEIQLMANYLSVRVHEFVSDVLGVLGTGPSSAIGFIGYMRGVKEGFLGSQGPYKPRETRVLKLTSGEHSLVIDPLQKPLKSLAGKGVLGRVQGERVDVCFDKTVEPGDPHPVDVLRPYAMLQIINLLDIGEKVKAAWESVIRFEMDKDLKDVVEIRFLKEGELSGSSQETSRGLYASIPLTLAIRTAEIAAKAVAEAKFESLKGLSLKDIVRWNSVDETVVYQIRVIFRDENEISVRSRDRIDARHILAAALMESMEIGAKISDIFFKMKQFLKDNLDEKPH